MTPTREAFGTMDRVRGHLLLSDRITEEVTRRAGTVRRRPGTWR